MAAPERDSLTGYHTTGHEWDGIKELNTPIPHWWVTVFLGSCLVAVLYMWLYPSFATTTGIFKGRLGWTSHGQLAEEMVQARAAQAGWRSLLTDTPLEQVEANADLRRFAIAGGRAAFNENCAPCHGVGAGGQIGQFPALVDDDWLWGGSLADIRQTVRYGIRSGHDETRQSLMPAFGEMLSAGEIDSIAAYVLTLSDPSAAASRARLPGAELYAANCAACHGAAGEGSRDMGAPRLNDAIWLYGGTRDAIRHQIANPRMGVMPAFAGKLDDDTIRMLALYVHSLGGGER
ncbi:cytochrome-c oxidase, cbb3-type subunit III [Ancylobacter polymorphus]|uniref:Cbb3-type cytochrome c oxidase subunit n=1 Tax=Ancylobacter polymorphus TaxID=223390 RepID=A0ABU0BKN5_9HYPH|nr:cytochrome-c oxidase, cbb3-type subunit III [Ancylobacter polymorphus]MDQ0305034.1 cytochrome c oxidase cbb3-type subunit 3 [Ancylobacter polymorphus]